MREVETGGDHQAIGKSGENGALQFLPSTWKAWSKDVAGRVLPFTPGNEQYVALRKVQHWIDSGHSNREIALIWNQGHPGACRRGVNGHGVAYDSCEHARLVLAAMID